MASPGSIVIQFRANADKAVKDIKKLTRSLDDVGDKASGTGRKLKKGLAVGAAAVGTAMLGAGAALVDFGERAIADAAASKRLEKALKNTTKATDAQVDAVEDWITQQGIALGVADDDLRPALARLARSTEDVTKAQELAGIAMDIAAATGKPLASVADALAKAYDGQSTSLLRMGIKLGEGEKGWTDLAKSVEGSAESQASSIEGTWDRVKLIFSEGAESLGGVVLAPLERFAEWLEDPANVGKVKTYLDNAAEGAYEAGEAFVGWINTTILPAIQTVYDYFNSADGKAQIKSWGDAFLNTAGAVQAFISKLDILFGLLDKLPGNVVLQKLGLIPRLSDLTSGGAGQPVATRDEVRAGNLAYSARQRAVKNNRGPSYTNAQGMTVYVNVTNPRQETALDSAALALRLAKATGGYS
jgi:hypothetical protein